MTMTDIKSMTQEEITDALRAMGEPAFRGKQVFSWLHKGATDFAEMNNLSKPLREKLGKEFTITAPTVARKQVSQLDGTVKYLWELRDGNCIETVLMSITTATLSASPRRSAAGWAANSAPPP